LDLSSELLDFVYAPENEATPLSPTLFSAPPTDEIDAERAFPAPPTDEIDAERAFPAPPTDETHRFGNALSKQELEQALRKRVPQNTQKATNWGLSVWRSWCKARQIAFDILTIPAETLNELMAQFVQEARRKDKSEYIPSSLLQLVAAIQRYLNENGRPEVRFFLKRKILLTCC
jgi:hypothetical protein